MVGLCVVIQQSPDYFISQDFPFSCVCVHMYKSSGVQVCMHLCVCVGGESEHVALEIIISVLTFCL